VEVNKYAIMKRIIYGGGFLLGIILGVVGFVGTNQEIATYHLSDVAPLLLFLGGVLIAWTSVRKGGIIHRRLKLIIARRRTANARRLGEDDKNSAAKTLRLVGIAIFLISVVWLVTIASIATLGAPYVHSPLIYGLNKLCYAAIPISIILTLVARSILLFRGRRKPPL